jgi:signal peptidase I
VTSARDGRGRRREKTGIFATLLMIVAAIAAWYLAGPAQLGGRDTYLITSGISMQPRIHTGDLAVVRKQDSYQIGDVVAYRLQDALILHRIVRTDGDQFIVKGDNNDFEDMTHPTAANIAGKMVIHIAGAGRLLAVLRQPGVLVLMALVCALLSYAGSRGAVRRRGRRAAGAAATTASTGGSRMETLSVALLVTVAALGLAIYAWRQPLTRAIQVPLPYSQAGQFSYSGPVSQPQEAVAAGTDAFTFDTPAPLASSVYPSGQVASGDPVFFRLVRNLNLGFDYRFASPLPHSVQGSYQLSVALSQPTGWRQTALLVPPTTFSGDHAAMNGWLDLYAVQAQINNFARDAGVNASGFELTVTPEVDLTGSLAGKPLHEHYAPSLPFKLDNGQMTLETTAGQDATAVLNSHTGAALSRPGRGPNVLALPLLAPTIAQARLLALVALAAGLLATAVLALPLLAVRKADEPARIRARYGAMLLDVHGAADAIPAQRIVDVGRPDDLVKIAEREGRMILHANGSAVHQYLVSDGEIVYRYRATAAAGREG